MTDERCIVLSEYSRTVDFCLIDLEEFLDNDLWFIFIFVYGSTVL